jgi:Skp family chaperone for outer membrane proteins
MEKVLSQKGKYLMFLVFILGTLVIFASRASFAAQEKFATVDIGKVFDEYEKTKKFDQQFQNEGKSKQEERDAIVHEVRRIRDEMALLSEEAKREKQGTVESKLKELDAFDGDTRKILGEKRNEAVRDVFQDIENVMTQYGERKGYDIIFNDRALLYKNKQYDVTADVLRELNDSYRKKKQ